MESIKNTDLRPPFIGLSIGLSILIVLYIDSITEMHWVLSALLTGILAFTFTKIVHIHPFFKKKTSEKFNRIFLVFIFVFIILAFVIIRLFL